MKLHTLALSTLIGLSFLPALLSVAEVPAGPHIITSGIASFEVVPDIVILMIAVSDLTKAAAKKQLDQRVAQYFIFYKNKILIKKISMQLIYGLKRSMITKKPARPY